MTHFHQTSVQTVTHDFVAGAARTDSTPSQDLPSRNSPGDLAFNTPDQKPTKIHKDPRTTKTSKDSKQNKEEQDVEQAAALPSPLALPRLRPSRRAPSFSPPRQSVAVIASPTSRPNQLGSPTTDSDPDEGPKAVHLDDHGRSIVEQLRLGFFSLPRTDAAQRLSQSSARRPRASQAAAQAHDEAHCNISKQISAQASPKSSTAGVDSADHLSGKEAKGRSATEASTTSTRLEAFVEEASSSKKDEDCQPTARQQDDQTAVSQTDPWPATVAPSAVERTTSAGSGLDRSVAPVATGASASPSLASAALALDRDDGPAEPPGEQTTKITPERAIELRSITANSETKNAATTPAPRDDDSDSADQPSSPRPQGPPPDDDDATTTLDDVQKRPTGRRRAPQDLNDEETLSALRFRTTTNRFKSLTNEAAIGNVNARISFIQSQVRTQDERISTLERRLTTTQLRLDQERAKRKQQSNKRTWTTATTIKRQPRRVQAAEEKKFRRRKRKRNVNCNVPTPSTTLGRRPSHAAQRSLAAPSRNHPKSHNNSSGAGKRWRVKRKVTFDAKAPIFIPSRIQERGVEDAFTQNELPLRWKALRTTLPGRQAQCCALSSRPTFASRNPSSSIWEQKRAQRDAERAIASARSTQATQTPTTETRRSSSRAWALAESRKRRRSRLKQVNSRLASRRTAKDLRPPTAADRKRGSTARLSFKCDKEFPPLQPGALRRVRLELKHTRGSERATCLMASDAKKSRQRRSQSAAGRTSPSVLRSGTRFIAEPEPFHPPPRSEQKRPLAVAPTPPQHQLHEEPATRTTVASPFQQEFRQQRQSRRPVQRTEALTTPEVLTRQQSMTTQGDDETDVIEDPLNASRQLLFGERKNNISTSLPRPDEAPRDDRRPGAPPQFASDFRRQDSQQQFDEHVEQDQRWTHRNPRQPRRRDRFEPDDDRRHPAEAADNKIVLDAAAIMKIFEVMTTRQQAPTQGARALAREFKRTKQSHSLAPKPKIFTTKQNWRRWVEKFKAFLPTDCEEEEKMRTLFLFLDNGPQDVFKAIRRQFDDVTFEVMLHELGKRLTPSPALEMNRLWSFSKKPTETITEFVSRFNETLAAQREPVNDSTAIHRFLDALGPSDLRMDLAKESHTSLLKLQRRAEELDELTKVYPSFHARRELEKKKQNQKMTRTSTSKQASQQWQEIDASNDARAHATIVQTHDPSRRLLARTRHGATSHATTTDASQQPIWKQTLQEQTRSLRESNDALNQRLSTLESIIARIQSDNVRQQQAQEAQALKVNDWMEKQSRDFNDLKNFLVSNNSNAGADRNRQRINFNDDRKRQNARRPTVDGRSAPITTQLQGDLLHPARRARMRCSRCGKTGHTIDTCWELRPELRDKWVRENPEKAARFIRNNAPDAATLMACAQVLSPLTSKPRRSPRGRRGGGRRGRGRGTRLTRQFSNDSMITQGSIADLAASSNQASRARSPRVGNFTLNAMRSSSPRTISELRFAAPAFTKASASPPDNVELDATTTTRTNRRQIDVNSTTRAASPEDLATTTQKLQVRLRQ